MDTNELLDMMSSDEVSSSEVHDAIKTLLYQKSAEMVDQITPTVAASQFGEVEEPTDAVESEPQEEE